MRLNGYAALSAIDSKLARAVADLTAPVETSIMHSLDGMGLVPYVLVEEYSNMFMLRSAWGSHPVFIDVSEDSLISMQCTLCLAPDC